MARIGTIMDGISSGTTTFQSKNLAAADMHSGVTAFTVNMPNVNGSAVWLVVIRLGYALTSHTYDSTRVAAFFVCASRTSGAAGYAQISSVVGAQIATVSGGNTMTFTLAAASSGAGQGGATAANTVAFTLTVTPSGTNTDPQDADMLFIPITGLGAFSIT